MILKGILLLCGALGAVFDLRDRRIPDGLILIGSGAALLYGIATGTLIPMLFRAMCVSGALLVVTLIAESVFRKTALGGGDLKLVFLLATGESVTGALTGLLFGLSGALLLRSVRKKRGAFPLAPYLFFGFFVQSVLRTISIYGW